MDLNKLVDELIMERNLIDQAIANLERLSTGSQGISRPPKRRTQGEKLPEQARTARAGID
jgi:hypothetical protein